ncbi:T9SS type A sorting domain-containing protein [candidate division WOR-3 bacterium]|nr:T9SS type A sorting domain-containing protein [candidate division WOR-3 bacterium]
MVRRYIGVIAICGICCILYALPEVFIENDDFPFVIGTYARYDQNISTFQWEEFDSTRLWWDLTGYPGGRTARVHLLHPSSGLPPAPDTFPGAEVLELDTLGNNDVVWTYMADTAYYLHVLGLDFSTGGLRFIGKYMPKYNCYVFPIYDGAGWLTAWTWTYEVYPGIPYSANETHRKRIVAKGKVKIPFSGEHFWPCLVIQDSMGYTDNFGSQELRWIYEWIVPGRFAGGNGVAAAQSTNGAGQNFLLVEHFLQQNTMQIPGWDLRCPDFATTTVWPDTDFAGPYPVSSMITDSTGIGADSLFYSINSADWLGIGHDSVNGDIYYYTIPQVVQSCTLAYLLWAEDSFSTANSVDIWNTDPICAPESTYYRFVVTTGIEEHGTNNVPVNSIQCFPNPFSSTTSIGFMHCGQPTCIRIYDAAGRIVRQFTENSVTIIPQASFTWDGKNTRGQRCASGVYFVELQTGQRSINETIVLIE